MGIVAHDFLGTLSYDKDGDPVNGNDAQHDCELIQRSGCHFSGNETKGNANHIII